MIQLRWGKFGKFQSFKVKLSEREEDEIEEVVGGGGGGWYPFYFAKWRTLY